VLFLWFIKRVSKQHICFVNYSRPWSINLLNAINPNMFMKCDHFTPKKQKECDKDNEKMNDWCQQHQWNDLIIKSIQTSLQVNHLTKECDKYYEKIDDWWRQYNDFVIKSIQRSLQIKSLRKRMWQRWWNNWWLMTTISMT
jgi:hypothetical protein